MTLLHIDGADGEGGGQLLRSALSCALITGRGFTMENIRAKRKPAGLKAQHLEAVRAAKAVGDAEVRGDELHSRWLRFVPKTVRGGEHEFRIATAGAAPLVLQTLFVPLALRAGARPRPCTQPALRAGTPASQPVQDTVIRSFHLPPWPRKRKRPRAAARGSVTMHLDAAGLASNFA